MPLSVLKEAGGGGQLYSLVLLLSIFLVSEMKIVLPGVLGDNYLMIREAWTKGLHLFFVSIKKDVTFLHCPWNISHSSKNSASSLRIMNLILIKMPKHY